MKGPLILKQIDSFKSYLENKGNKHPLHFYECLQNYRNHWDLGELDLSKMIDQSFSSKISNRLWVDHHFEPKKIMMQFISMEKEFVRSMFRDLFITEKDLMMRINRFIFHCDSLLEELNQKDRRFNAHYHDNYKMISIYLAFEYPEKYAIYNYKHYSSFLEKIGALKIPLENEVDRFFKIMSSFYNNFLVKDTELMGLHHNRFYDNSFFKGHSLLLATEFYLHPFL